jgi:hypothetical protein
MWGKYYNTRNKYYKKTYRYGCRVQMSPKKCTTSCRYFKFLLKKQRSISTVSHLTTPPQHKWKRWVVHRWSTSGGINIRSLRWKVGETMELNAWSTGVLPHFDAWLRMGVVVRSLGNIFCVSYYTMTNCKKLLFILKNNSSTFNWNLD